MSRDSYLPKLIHNRTAEVLVCTDPDGQQSRRLALPQPADGTFE